MGADWSPGLENVIAGETAISWLDVDNEIIVVRGYDLIELANGATYMDVVGLLLDGVLPDAARREALEGRVKAEYGLPGGVVAIFGLLPASAHPMDALRTGISALASYDEELDDASAGANFRKSIRLLAKVPQIVAAAYRSANKLPLVEPRADLSYSANFLWMITGTEPTPEEERTFDRSLIAYVEHEMPNSTFAARVIASTLSDLYGAMTGAAASLKGHLHGGANEAVMEMLEDAGDDETFLESIMLAKLARKERIMGFGHRVYMKKPDPRAVLMREALAGLAEAKGRQALYRTCVRGEQVMQREKGLYPNLDYYAAPVFHLLGIPTSLFTPVFLAARTAGIGAHVVEQHSRNRLFRPRVSYIGDRNMRLPPE